MSKPFPHSRLKPDHPVEGAGAIEGGAVLRNAMRRSAAEYATQTAAVMAARQAATGTGASRLATAADLGVVVRERRKTLGMTQQDVADAAGTGRRLVSELEAGKPTLEIGKILAVCQALGLDLGVTTR